MIDFISEESIRILSGRPEKKKVLELVAAEAQQAPNLKDKSKDIILNKLMEREELATTGLADGIAIPHCSFADVEVFTTGLLIFPDGIGFDALDGKKTHLVFYIIAPENQRSRHIVLLSSISRIAKDKKLLKKIITAKDPKEVHGLLTQEAEQVSVDTSRSGICQAVIHVSNEHIFEEVLEIVTSRAEGAVSVIEAAGASQYLNKLPLFATFWNENESDHHKIILAYIDERFINDTVRKINSLPGGDPANKNILISVQRVMYHSGALDY